MTEEEFWGREMPPQRAELMLKGWLAGPSNEDYYDAVLRYFERNTPHSSDRYEESYTEGKAVERNT